jgi:hypothetical protein
MVVTSGVVEKPSNAKTALASTKSNIESALEDQKVGDKVDPEKASIVDTANEVSNYSGMGLAQPFKSDDDETFLGPGKHPCLDMIRTLCVWLVCVDHGGTEYGIYNTMFVQSWVLQYLYLVCGICYAMSSKSLGAFQLRLLGYFCLGVGCNLTAWIIAGQDWRHDIFNVVFQFWFVFGLMVFIAILAPLKASIVAQRQSLSEVASAWQNFEPKGVLLLAGYVLIYATYMLIICPFVQRSLSGIVYRLISPFKGPGSDFWDIPQSKSEAEEFVNSYMMDIRVSLMNVYIVLVFPRFNSRVSLIGWLVILNSYAFKMTTYRGPEARMINAFDFTMIGLVVYVYGLRYRKLIGEYLVRYWFVTLFLCGILWPLGVTRRFDEHPPEHIPMRVRYNLLEAFFLVLFLTAAERTISFKIFTEDKLEFLNYWSLVLFLVHKAVHILVPVPFNWLVLLGLSVPCYLVARPSTQAEPTVLVM